MVIYEIRGIDRQWVGTRLEAIRRAQRTNGFCVVFEHHVNMRGVDPKMIVLAALQDRGWATSSRVLGFWTYGRPTLVDAIPPGHSASPVPPPPED